MNQFFEAIVKELSKLQEVEALALAGSQSSGTADENSDYDLYVYSKKEIPLDKRKAILDQYCEYMEYNNQYWETEDDGRLKDGIGIEIIYRSLEWIINEIDNVIVKENAGIGYSTCFWFNIQTSKILFDRSGKLTEIIQSCQVSYPQNLKRGIIEKNNMLLEGSVTSYDAQIKKAILRHDIISVNHRVAAFLESYFDIIFALNELPHPGEKKLIKICENNCEILPNDFAVNLEDLIKRLPKCDNTIMEQLYLIIKELRKIVNQ